MRFFHISDDVFLHGQTIYPRIPASKMNNENDSIKRICVAPSIQGCLSGAGRYKEGETLTIYTCSSEMFIQPSEDEVLDAPLTGECWIVEPVTLSYFATIVIQEVIPMPVHEMPHFLYTFSFIEKSTSPQKG